MNIRAISILIVAGTLILIGTTAAITAQATGDSLRKEIYDCDLSAMSCEQRNLLIQARYCFETGKFDSAASCVKKLRAMRGCKAEGMTK